MTAACSASASTSCASATAVHVTEGGIVPADGVLLSEQARVDEALLSGESSPVSKRRGDRLIAGTVLEGGPLQIRVDRVGADTTLSWLAALVGRAQAERPGLVRAGEAQSGRLVRRVFLSTAAAVAFWLVVDPTRAFSAAVAGAGDLLSLRVCAGRAGRAGTCARCAGAPRRAGGEARCAAVTGRMHARRLRQDGHAHRHQPVAGRCAHLRRGVA